jgi:hypothetical protein
MEFVTAESIPIKTLVLPLSEFQNRISGGDA